MANLTVESTEALTKEFLSRYTTCVIGYVTNDKDGKRVMKTLYTKDSFLENIGLANILTQDIYTDASA